MNVLHIHSGKERADEINKFLTEKSCRIISAESFDAVKAVFDSRMQFDLAVVDFDYDRHLVHDVLIFLRNNEQYLNTPVILNALSETDDILTKCLAFARIYLYDRDFDRETFEAIFDEAVNPSSETVLLVDDEAMVREVLKTTLERDGYNIVEVSSGKQALKVLETKEIDLVISDIRMPEMDGLELLAIIKRRHEDVPVFLISGYVGDGPNDDLLQSGADGVIAKPFKYLDIASAVRDVLDKKKIAETQVCDR